MGVTYLHHLDRLALMNLSEHGRQCRPINQFVRTSVTESGRERGGQRLRIGFASTE